VARVDAGHLLLRAGGLPLRAYPCVETPRSRPEPSSPSSLPWSSLPFPGSLSLAVPHLTGPRRRYRRAPPRLSPPPRPLERSRSSAMTCSSSSLRQTTPERPAAPSSLLPSSSAPTAVVVDSQQPDRPRPRRRRHRTRCEHPHRLPLLPWSRPLSTL